MTTVSIPVSDNIRKKMDDLVRSGHANNLSDVARKAFQKYFDDLAVEAVLQAQKEPSLEGDLDELSQKL